MRRRFSEGFTLLEVMIATAILSTAIVVIFGALKTIIFSTKFSQDLSFACFLLEERLSDIEIKYKINSATAVSDTATDKETRNAKEFTWSYKITPVDADGRQIKKVELLVKWPESNKRQPTQSIVTYLAPRGP